MIRNDIYNKNNSIQAQLPKWFIFTCMTVIFFWSCSKNSENITQPSIREQLEVLSETYDQDFLLYLDRAHEAIGKNILTYSPISNQFTIPKYMEISGSYYDYGLLVGHIASQNGTQPRTVSNEQEPLNNRIIQMYRRIYPQFLDIARGVGNVFEIPWENLDFTYLEEGFFNGLWYNLFKYPDFESLGQAETATSTQSGENCAVVSARLPNTNLVGRNFDNDRERPHFVVYTRMEGAYKVLANASYALYHWVMDGINEKGLVMATANQASPSEYYSFFDPYPNVPVINEHHMFRIALETCATVDEVIELYQSVRPWSPDYADHLMVADAQGNSAVIGLGIDREPAFFRSENTYQVLTNTAYQMGFDYLMETCWRFQQASDMAEQGINSLDDIQAIMQSIRGRPYGFMSLYDIRRGLMRLILRHDFTVPWDFNLGMVLDYNN